jgi:hypothetical protein
MASALFGEVQNRQLALQLRATLDGAYTAKPNERTGTVMSGGQVLVSNQRYTLSAAVDLPIGSKITVANIERPAAAVYAPITSGGGGAGGGGGSGSMILSNDKIGGFTISATSLTSGSGANFVALDSGGINPAIYVGSETPSLATFQVSRNGFLNATGATITGNITATSGVFGGWTLGANAIYTGTEDHDAYTTNPGDITLYSNGTDASIHASKFYLDTTGTIYAKAGYFGDASTRVIVEAAGLNVGNTGSIRGGQTAYNTGEGFWLGYASSAYKLSIGNGATKSLVYDGTDLRQNGAIIGSIGLGSEPAMQGWQMTCIFSATDADTVAWETGQFILADGTSNTIAAGNTGNMAAKTYIYWDKNASLTAFQYTTTAAYAMGTGKVLIAVAVNSTVEARFQVFSGYGGLKIAGSDIEAKSILANNLTVTAGGANLLLNSTFQTDTDANGAADGWGQYNPSSALQPGTLTIVATGGVDNRAFQRLTWAVTNTTNKGLYTDSDLSGGVQGGWLANTSYIVSFYAKTSGMAGSPQLPNLAWNVTPATTAWLAQPVISAAWKRYSVRITWGASVEEKGRLYLYIAGAISGNIEFDHVQVEQADTPSSWKPFPSELEPGSVTADKIYVTSLAAIKVDTGALNMSGFLTIGAAGGVYQGTGTAASPTTGLKLWNDGGVGRIAGYNATVLQWYADTDGKLYAGAGRVWLDASGISLAGLGLASAPESNPGNAVNFSSTGVKAQMYYKGENNTASYIGIAAYAFGSANGEIHLDNPTYITGDANATGVYKIDGTKVVGNRVVDNRCDDTVNTSTWDSTTAGVLDSLRDAMITHGLIAAA